MVLCRFYSPLFTAFASNTSCVKNEQYSFRSSSGPFFIILYYSLVDFTTQIPSFYFIRRVFLAKEIRRAGVLPLISHAE